MFLRFLTAAFTYALACIFFNIQAYSATKAAPLVVVSIKPLHSLTTHIMQGRSTPKLLLEGQTSPHHTALKPSQARLLEQADLVIWTSHELEAFLQKPLSLKAQNTSLELIDSQGLDFPEKINTEDKDSHHNHEHDHARDPHIWLNPHNAIAIAKTIASQLSLIDPKAKDLYQKNTMALIEKLKDLERDISQELAPNKAVALMTFHDAYGHFAQRFGLEHYHSMTLHPNDHFGAARIKQLQHTMAEENIKCLFSEPQFSASTLHLLQGKVPSFMGVLDPLGSTIETGRDHYFATLKKITASLKQCANYVTADR